MALYWSKNITQVVSTTHLNQIEKIHKLKILNQGLLPVCFFESLQSQDEKLCIMLIREGWERNSSEPTTFKPMHSCGVDGNCLFTRNICTIFNVVMLPLLFCLQIKSCQSSKVLLASSFVYSGSSFYPLSVIMCSVCPPVCLCFHIPVNIEILKSGETKILFL